MGVAIGDGAGRYYEGVEPGWLQLEFRDPLALMKKTRSRDLRYTDDTQMAVAIAEALVESGEIVEEVLCRQFVENYHPWRGYGRGARAVLEAMREERDYKEVAANHFPGGSYGNGGAMRVAPVGFFFQHDLDLVWEQAKLSALPTHVHPLGIEGAQLVAIATALAATCETFDRDAFYKELLERCVSDEYRNKLEQAEAITNVDEIEKLGNGIAALESAITAIACFAEHPESFELAIAQAIHLGGDTDTIAAMAGGISGAYLGLSAIPAELINQFEDEHKGRSYILKLADQLHEAMAKR